MSEPERATVPWAGVIALHGRETIDGRLLDLTVEDLPALIYEPALGIVPHVGTIERVWQDGDFVRAAGVIDATYAGRTLTGGVDVRPVHIAVDVDDPDAPMKISGPLRGFAIGTDPAWPEVSITVEPLPGADNLSG